MHLLTRRGFTLIELVVALVILGIVSGAIYKVLLTNQQTYTAQTQGIDLQQNLRAGAALLPAEFRELNAAGELSPGTGDIGAMTATSLRIRAMRQLGFLCVTPALGGGGQIKLWVRQTPIFGSKQTYADGDSVLVFYEGSVTTRNDDSWVPGKVTKIDAGTCPDSTNGLSTPHPATLLTLQPKWLPGQLNIAGAITTGSPVRGFSSVVYGLYLSPSDSRYYVGQSVGIAAMQPLIGPLSGANGLQFVYYDSTGTGTTTDSSKVAMIEIHLYEATAARVRQATSAGVNYKIDSLVTRVSLRNNPRCGPCF